MSSGVGGMDLQIHCYSDEKWILLITIPFIPMHPCLFSLSHGHPAGSLSLHPRGVLQRPLLSPCSSHSFHFPWLCLPVLFLYACDVLSLLCPFLVFSHLPCGFFKDILTKGLTCTDSYVFDEDYDYDMQGRQSFPALDCIHIWNASAEETCWLW